MRRWSPLCALVVMVALLVLVPRPLAAQAGNPTARALLDGAWNAADWPAVLAILDTMGTREATLAHKYQAHLNYGWELLADGQCPTAHSQFERALGLMPGSSEAKQGLTAAERRCPNEVISSRGGAPRTVASPVPAGETTPFLAPTPAPVGEPTRHIVQPGETLFGLAQRYGLSLAELQRANGLTDDILRAGQTLLIPAPSAAAPAPGEMLYVVRPNDTLYSIARRYGTTVIAIRQANQLSSDQIRVDQNLVIPTGRGAHAARTHRVAQGDTLFSLARRYGITVEDLRAANGLVDDRIVTGALLIIP